MTITEQAALELEQLVAKHPEQDVLIPGDHLLRILGALRKAWADLEAEREAIARMLENFEAPRSRHEDVRISHVRDLAVDIRARSAGPATDG